MPTDTYQLDRIAEAVAVSPLGAQTMADLHTIGSTDEAFARRCYDVAAALLAEGKRRTEETPR